MIMSPLSKPSPGNPDIAERFELYAGGMELCNAYTELNDPEIQRKTLLTQVFNSFNNREYQKVRIKRNLIKNLYRSIQIMVCPLNT